MTLATCLSAASFLAAGWTGGQAGKLSKVENDVWNSLRSSVVVIHSGGSDRGVAICIDPKGLFVAHKNLVQQPLVFGRMKNGQLIQLNVRAIDATTELALLRADVGTLLGLNSVAVADEPATGELQSAFALVSSGALKTEVVSVDKLGIMQPTRRAVPLMELRFEAPLTRIGGAPIFTDKGKLLGFLSASLPTDENKRIANQQANAKSGLSRGVGGGVTVTPQQYGPTGLTVAYAIGPSAMSRVVDGFRSPEREVVFPALGIVIGDAQPTGAEVKEVSERSAAAEAGLQTGDIILEIGSDKIRNQIDYAKYMMRRKVGEPLTVKVLRSGETLVLKATPRH